MGKSFFNKNESNIIYLNHTQLELEQYDLITINFDTFIHLNRVFLLNKYFAGEFTLLPTKITTMDQLLSEVFYQIKPILKIKNENQFKINKNFQKIISKNQIIISDRVDCIFRKSEIRGYSPRKFKTPIKNFSMRMRLNFI
tara:strand:- start:269 stop:691 length:423 start_codon:yes stop_codon:yes gene_type:complete